MTYVDMLQRAPQRISSSATEMSKMPFVNIQSISAIHGQSFSMDITTEIKETVFLEDCQFLRPLNKEIKEILKGCTGKSKTYYENCLLMQVAIFIDGSTSKENMVFAKVNKKRSLRAVVCNNGYILTPRSLVTQFQSLSSWTFCSSIMKPDITIYYYPPQKKVDIRNQRKMLMLIGKIKKHGMPLMFIEEESSRIDQTARSCATKLIELYRLRSARGYNDGPVVGFALPRKKNLDYHEVASASVDFSEMGAEDADVDIVSDDEGEADNSFSISAVTDDGISTAAQPPAQKKPRTQLVTAPVKISVVWSLYQFTTGYMTYQYAESTERLGKEIKEALQQAQDMEKACSDSKTIADYGYLVKLSDDNMLKLHETHLLHKDLQITAVKQLHASPSFVFHLTAVKNGRQHQYVTKIFTDRCAKENFEGVDCTIKDAEPLNICTTLGCKKKYWHIFYFDVLKSPLKRSEARNCIYELGKAVERILNDMHSKLGYAHLDVRLPNICYSDTYEPVLIDVERAQPVDELYVNYMYGKDNCTYPDRLTFGNIDTIQLLWMIFWIEAEQLGCSMEYKYTKLQEVDCSTVEYLKVLQQFILNITNYFRERKIDKANDELKAFWNHVDKNHTGSKMTLKDVLQLQERQ